MQQTRTNQVNKDPCKLKLVQTNRTAPVDKEPCKGENLFKQLEPLRLIRSFVRERTGAKN